MKFSIRDLLWLTVVVAMALSWWLHISSSRREAEEKLNNLLTALESRGEKNSLQRFEGTHP